MNFKTTARTIAAIAALVALPLIARAATTPVTPHPLGVEFGFNWTTNSTTQQFAHTLYDFQLDYDVTGGKGPIPISAYGQYGWASTKPIGGVNVNFNEWQFGVQAQTRTQIYGGLGVGYVGQNGNISISGLGSGSASASGVGGTAFIGADLHKPNQSGPGIKLGYNVWPNFQSLNTDNWYAALTYRI